MKDFMTILKEVGISLLIIIIVAAADVFAFKDIFPMDMTVPEAQTYTNLVRDNYKVVGDIQDAENPMETYEADSSELELYQTELRYIPGSVNPFVSEGGESNLPSEKVNSPVGSDSTSDDMYEEENATVIEDEDSSNEDAD